MPYVYRGQQIGLRIVTQPCDEYLIVFKSEKQYEKAIKNLRRQCLMLEPDFEKPVGHWTRLWQEKLISNFAYIMVLNLYSSRSFEDLSQYPIMPWVTANYKTAEVTGLQKRHMRVPVGCHA